METDCAIALEEVSKRYGGGRQATAALSDVTLVVARGEFLAVTGESGSGKTTLLNLIAGLDTPCSGRVLVAGDDIARASDDFRSDLRLRHIGFVFQTFNLFPTFTLEENVAWPLGFLGVGRRACRERAREMLARVGVVGATQARRPAEVSGGEQQRTAIARALVTEPQMLLADEPTGNLDSRTARAILGVLAKLNTEQGVTVVLVTHNRRAAACAHRTIRLRDGRVVLEDRSGWLTRRRSDRCASLETAG
jgi:putative ABC transport system ATP-binding protein